MPDFENIIDSIKRVLELIFQGNAPAWISQVVGVILAIVITVFLIWMFMFFVSKIMDLWVEKLSPAFYKREDRRRSKQRGQFADDIEIEVRRLNSLEQWSDFRFAELEAEVEAEGRKRIFSLIPFVSRTGSGLRREPSLSRALRTSIERLVLLEGNPGSGKSVALRHVVLSLARRAREHPRTNSVIPLYINLKELRRDPGESIDYNLIHSFVMKSLNRMKDRDIDKFLEEEFDKGLHEGTWLFLFDSFDEIPEVLAATEADTNTRMYAEAIVSFMLGMNQCRGIIASRQFRGPDLLGWPRFHIKELSEQRRLDLIKKADLLPQLEKRIFRDLAAAPADIRAMTRNPMFLGLLCDQVNSQGSFPQNTHDMLGTHITNRLSHDETRILQRFKIEIGKVRTVAENFAFSMGIDARLGLSPTRTELHDALVRLKLETDEDFEVICDVLEYVKLARSETTDLSSASSKTFSFSHRRFQEYFATCVVLRDPKNVNPRQLLTDGRWRETAVTLFQTQPLECLQPILQEVRFLVTETLNKLSNLIDDPVEYVLRENIKKDVPGSAPFPWPQGSLHVLDLLQQGFIRRTKDIPDDIRIAVARLVLSATVEGTLIDKKWALEVAGTVPPPVLLWLLAKAFPYKSRWLGEVAYRQASRLAEFSDDIAGWIRSKLVRSALDGSLGRERFETEAFLARLPNSADFLAIMRLLLWIPFTSAAFNIGMILILTIYFSPQSHQLLAAISLAFLFLLSVVIRKRYPFSKGLQRFPLLMSFLMVYVMVAVLLVVPGILKESSPLLYLLYACFLFWPAFAFLIAKEGKFYQLFWWPFYPVIYTIISILRVPSTFVRFFRSMRVRSLLLMGSFLAGFGILMFLLWHYSNQNKTISSEVILGFMGISVLYVSFILCRDLLFWLHDWNIWRTWYKSQTVPISLEGLLESLNQYKWPTFYIRTIRFIREKGGLISNEGIDAQLQQLVLTVERAQVVGSTHGSKHPIVSVSDSKRGDFKFINDWLSRYKWNDPNSPRELGPEFLDEICMLAEQMRVISNSGRKPINLLER